jgi:Zn-dependent protease
MKSDHSSEREANAWWKALIAVLLLLPLLLLFLFPVQRSVSMIAFWLFVIVVVNVVLAWLFLRERGAARAANVPAPPRLMTSLEIPPIVEEVMQVEMATDAEGIRLFRGSLRESPETAYSKLKQSFGDTCVPMVQSDKQTGAAIYLLPNEVEEAVMEKPVRLWLHWLLFALTFLTTTWAGALHQGVNLLKEPERFTVGLPYSIGLLAILGFHELGHYFTARHYQMRVTPPFFIPVPFALGTFGAFIQMRSPAEDRRALFDVAVAGPLAGLVLAIPALYFGLKSSTILPVTTELTTQLSGDGLLRPSILFGLIANASLGSQLDGEKVLQMSPLAFAGWLGFLVTALNLLPIGQLDGGHIARAIFGHRTGEIVGRVGMGLLFALALFVMPNLLFWAVIVFFLARRTTPPLNDLSPLSVPRKILGIISFIILALILIPMPQHF